MRYLWAPLLLLSCLGNAAEVKLKLSSGGQHVGFGTLYYGFQSDGSFREVADYKFQEGTGEQIRVWVQSIYRKDGKLSEQMERISSPRGLMQSMRIAYSDKGVRIEKMERGNKSEQEIPWPTPAPTPAEAPAPAPIVPLKNSFWFTKNRPTVGEEHKGILLNSDSLQWMEGFHRFEGREKIQVGRRTFNANKVRGFNSIEWLDDAGLPYRQDFQVKGRPIVAERL